MNQLRCALWELRMSEEHGDGPPAQGAQLEAGLLGARGQAVWAGAAGARLGGISAIHRTLRLL